MPERRGGEMADTKLNYLSIQQSKKSIIFTTFQESFLLTYLILLTEDNNDVERNATQKLISPDHFTIHKQWPEELDISWRVAHSVTYFTGGITFLIGSIMYIPPLATNGRYY